MPWRNARLGWKTARTFPGIALAQILRNSRRKTANTFPGIALVQILRNSRRKTASAFPGIALAQILRNSRRKTASTFPGIALVQILRNSRRKTASTFPGIALARRGRIALGACFLAATASHAWALDKVTFGANWLAEAEHGGFYQALVDGTYAHYGLDVKILPGGPQSNNQLLLPLGKIDFYMGGDLLNPFNAAAQHVPMVAIASMFQKDPQIFMSHPGVGFDRFEDLRKATMFVGKEAFATTFQWLKSQWGFKEENVKPYTFDSAPFIADPHSAQQGYVTAEPYSVEKLGGFKPNVFLLYDYGFKTYSTLIETRPDLIAQKPDVVQRFVDASIIGWYNYIYGDPSKANAAIKTANPDMTDEQLNYSRSKMKEYGIVDSGDSLSDGIGAMKMPVVKSFFDAMTRAGVTSASVDYSPAFDLRFVNKKVGLNLRPQQR